MSDEGVYVVGQVYFEVKYSERCRKYPLIETFVFLGKNLSDEDAEETWYFQYAQSFAKDGSVLTGSEGDRRVACLTKKDLVEMFTEEQLFEKLKAARQRRSEETP
jgi:hypothetical protein